MERNVSVRTPESIAFFYELAGLGSRFLALAVDTVVQFAIGIAFFLLIVAASSGARSLGRLIGLSATAMQSIIAAILVLIAFVLFVGYFIAFETLWNGQTPGKRAIGIRVVRDGGYPITFMDAVIRNLVRTIEAALMYVPSIVSALVSSQNKRLGDLAAGTIVVRDRALEVADPARWMSADASSEAAPLSRLLDRVTDEECALAQRYVDRSHLLAPPAARDTAARIAAVLRPKLGAEAANLSDHDLLTYVATHAAR